MIRRLVVETAVIVVIVAGLAGAHPAGATSPTTLVVGTPTTATVGVAFSFTVTAESEGATVPTDDDTISFSSTDPSASLPATGRLNDGTGTFTATLETAGPQTITATDTQAAGVTGTSSPITVSAAGASTVSAFDVTAPDNASAGTAVSVTVSAESPSDTVVTGYSGTITFTSTDQAATLPGKSSLTDGTGTFDVTFGTAGAQTVTVTDTSTSVRGTSNAILVAGAVTHLAVTAPATVSAGVAFGVTVTAEDANDYPSPTDDDTVSLGSSDSAADLPAAAALTNGTGSFTLTLNTTGSQTITATDTSNSGITGTSATITVAGAATHLVLTAPTDSDPGVQFTFTVSAEDANSDLVPGYEDTVSFTSSDAAAVLPIDTIVSGGSVNAIATLNTPGSQTITATDTSNGSITGAATVVVTNKALTTLAGSDRIATAIAVSQASFPSGDAGAVVLARDDTFADALAGGPLAAAKDAPLLLTPPTGLDPRVATELQRVLAPGGNVYLLGGSDALSTAVQTAVAGLGFTIVRLAGADRFATAVQIATAGLGSPDVVFLATGDDFADALSGAPAAAATGGAILLTDDAVMPASTAAYIDSTARQVYALGGPAAAAYPPATALVGADRYATSAMVASQFFPKAVDVGFASGLNFPDGLSGGAQMAKLGGPMLLVDPTQTTLPASVVTYLNGAEATIEAGTVYGGTASVPSAVVAAAAALS
jgi:putative cell wall-binding protein